MSEVAHLYGFPSELEALKGWIATISEEMRQINDKVISEKRSYRPDENKHYEDLERQLEGHLKRKKQLETKSTFWVHGGGPQKSDARSDVMEYAKAVSNYRFNEQGTEVRDVFNRWLRHGDRALSPGEYRALQADQDPKGGFLVLPEAVTAALIQGLNDEVFIRQLASTFTVKANSTTFPVLANRIQDPEWRGEIQESSLDTSMSFEARNLSPHRLALGIKVSRKFLRLSTVNPEDVIRGELLYKAGYTQENGFLNGSGANRPLGVFTNTQSGIGSDRDCAIANTSTSIQADNLVECVNMLKAQYLRSPSLAWIFSRTAIKQIMKLKGGDGQMLWGSGLAESRPPTILGIRYYISELCPATFSASQYVGVLGDWSKYYIVDSQTAEIQRLVEKYALEDNDAFLLNLYTDGAPVLSEAFVRVKLGA